MAKKFLAAGFVLLLCISLGGAACAETVKNPERLYQPGSYLARLFSSHFGLDENDVITTGQNCHYPDDVIVTLYLASATGKGTHTINAWRKSSVSWMGVMDRLGFSPSRLFTRTGGPVPAEFSHAYGQYARWQANPAYRMELFDKEIRNLAGVRFMAARFGVSPLRAMERRSTGASFTQMILEKMD